MGGSTLEMGYQTGDGAQDRDAIPVKDGVPDKGCGSRQKMGSRHWWCFSHGMRY